VPMSSPVRVRLTCMPHREPIETTNLDAIFGSPPIPWATVRERLGARPFGRDTACYLGTVRPDGRPHSAGVGPAWLDGDLYFQTGPGTRKGRNIAANPACTLSVRLPDMDLVFEGDARRVMDAPTLEAVAASYREGNWPVQVEGEALAAAYSAPSAGPPPWHLFRIAFDTVFCVAGGDPSGATRWRF
jgi:hypothetical protein